MFAKYSADVAFIEPELAQADDKYLQSLIDDKDFFAYDYQIKRIMQGKPHMLSEEKERLIGMLGETFSTFNETYSMINNVDFPFPEIELDGKEERSVRELLRRVHKPYKFHYFHLLRKR